MLSRYPTRGNKLLPCRGALINIYFCRYIKITLPEESASLNLSHLTELQEQFEEMLIDHSLLKVGIEAAGDEVKRSVQERSAIAARSIRESTTEYAVTFCNSHTFS